MSSEVIHVDFKARRVKSREVAGVDVPLYSTKEYIETITATVAALDQDGFDVTKSILVMPQKDGKLTCVVSMRQDGDSAANLELLKRGARKIADTIREKDADDTA